MEPLISPQVNAVLQAVILVLLFVSLAVKQRKRYSMHGITMFTAVVLNLLSLVLIMIPSLLSTEIIFSQPLHLISITMLVHSGLGVVTVILGVWLVASWRLQSSLKNCIKNRRLMRVTIALWLIVLAVGFLLYYLLYRF